MKLVLPISLFLTKPIFLHVGYASETATTTRCESESAQVITKKSLNAKKINVWRELCNVRNIDSYYIESDVTIDKSANLL